MAAASPTTTVYRVPHIHLPHVPVTDLVVGALIAVTVLALWRASAAAEKRRRELVDGAEGIAKSRLRGTDIGLAKMAWGARPYEFHGKHFHRLTLKHDHTHRIDDELLALLEGDLERILGPVRAKHNPRRRTITVMAHTPTPDLPKRIIHPATPLDGFDIPFATALDGSTVAWKGGASNPHALVCGESGGGKSECINTMVREACRRGYRAILCDPKRISLPVLRHWPGIERYVSDVDDMAATIAEVAAEVERRTKVLEAADEAGRNRPELAPLILVIDEYATAIIRWRKAWVNAGNKGEPPVLDNLIEIGLTGRALRVRILFAAQRPDTKYLPGPLRDQLGCRVLVGPQRNATRRMMEIETDLGRQVPPGRAVAQVGGEKVCQVWVAESEAELAPIRPARPIPPVLTGNLSSAGQADGVVNGSTDGVSDAADVPVQRGAFRRADGTQAPIPESIAAEIRRLHEEGVGLRETARRLKVSTATVSKYRQADRPLLHVVRDGD